MKSSTPTLSHRTLAVSLLVSILFAVYIGAIQPIIKTYNNYCADIEHAQLQLSKLRQMANSKEQLELRLSETQNGIAATREYFVTGDTAALAAAGLQNHLTQIVRSANESTGSIRVIPDTEEHNMAKIMVAARFRSKVENLRKILYEIETSFPLLFLEKLSIRSHKGNSRQKAQNVEQPMDIELQVYGFRRPPLIGQTLQDKS